MTMQAIIPAPTPAPVALAADDAAVIAENRKASKAGATMRAYRSALQGKAPRYTKDGAPVKDRRKWPTFEAWCTSRGYAPIPAAPEVIEAYLGTLAQGGASVATIEQRRAAIGFMHEAAGLANPCKSAQVKAAMSGIRRKLGTKARPVDALAPHDAAAMLAALGDDPRGLRDRAMILIGFAGAFRRSELVALTVADVTIRRYPDGREVMGVIVQRSKTDQEAAGMSKTIPAADDPAVCPVRAYRAWLDVAGIHSGPVFRMIDRWGNVHPGAMNGQEVARVVKRAAQAAGIDPRRLAGHSLRSGYVTAATLAGQRNDYIMEQTGHKSETTLRRYQRTAGLGAIAATDAVFAQMKRR
jgi:integrase